MQEFFEKFFAHSTNGMLERFAALPNARMKDRDYVYIPGTRPNAVLLVAHADTHYNVPCYTVEWMGNVAKAGFNNRLPNGGYQSTGFNLGADDRVGCALLWSFRNSGHSLLITNGEEKGGIGARAAARDLADELGDSHQFAIQVDRRGDQEMVFYDVGTDEFKTWMFRQSHFRIGQGSFTDIKAICPAAGICGVNFAAGYIGEHRHDELFFMDAWLRTRAVVGKILKMEELPKFATKKIPFTGGGGDWRGRSGAYSPPLQPATSGNNTPTHEKKGKKGKKDKKDKEENLPHHSQRPAGFVVESLTSSSGKWDQRGSQDGSGQAATEQGGSAVLVAPGKSLILVEDDKDILRFAYDLTSDAYKEIVAGVQAGIVSKVDTFLWEDAGGRFTLYNQNKRYGELTTDEKGRVVLINHEGLVIWQEIGKAALTSNID